MIHDPCHYIYTIYQISSIGMAKSALEAVGGLNLYGKGYGTTTSTIMVMNILEPNMIRRSRS